MKIPATMSPSLVEPAAVTEQKEKLKAVSQQFEAIFVNQLVGEMRKTVNRSDLVPESQGEKVYQSMLDNEYSQKIADSDQLGLAKIVYEHLLRINSLG